MKQASLFPVPKEFHGGDLNRSRRKCVRPLARKRPIHLVMKADCLLIPARPWIQAEIRRFAARFAIKVYSLTVSPDHIHLVIEIPSRRGYVAFIRSLSSRIAKRLGKAIWKTVPFTRVAHWGRDFENLMQYLKQNDEEMRVERAYVPRKDYYRRFRSKQGQVP